MGLPFSSHMPHECGGPESNAEAITVRGRGRTITEAVLDESQPWRRLDDVRQRIAGVYIFVWCLLLGVGTVEGGIEIGRQPRTAQQLEYKRAREEVERALGESVLGGRRSTV